MRADRLIEEGDGYALPNFALQRPGRSFARARPLTAGVSWIL